MARVDWPRETEEKASECKLWPDLGTTRWNKWRTLLNSSRDDLAAGVVLLATVLNTTTN